LQGKGCKIWYYTQRSGPLIRKGPLSCLKWTRGLDFPGLIRWAALSNYLLRLARGCWEHILTPIPMDLHSVTHYDTQGYAEDLFSPSPTREKYTAGRFSSHSLIFYWQKRTTPSKYNADGRCGQSTGKPLLSPPLFLIPARYIQAPATSGAHYIRGPLHQAPATSGARYIQGPATFWRRLHQGPATFRHTLYSGARLQNFMIPYYHRTRLSPEIDLCLIFSLFYSFMLLVSLMFLIWHIWFS
jgi:hypothetical protein